MTTGAYSAKWQQLFDLSDQSGPTAPPTSQTSAHMSLASATAGGTAGDTAAGGGDADLHHSDEPWTKAAGVAEELHTTVTTAKRSLTTAHEDVSPGLAGLASAAALASVLTSWEKRLGSVGSECGSLAPKLRLVAKGQGERNAEVKSAFAGLERPREENAK
ncbi:hypothetical protein AB0O07_23055 [Streptomyces sp. NPDC093085]|uniref:hypothetical protein n=1 Tax=Streptomyces sp. NPDC093085 TaxID=3155068 RepID=UPI00342FF1C3